MRSRPLIYIILLLTITSIAVSQDSLNVETVGRYYENQSSSVAIQVQDTLAFVATNYDGLHIYSISDPANPVEISNINLPGIISSLILDSNIAYLSAEEFGVCIVDVSDPLNPELLTIFENETLYDCTIQDNLMFCAAGWDGIIIRDISDPANPSYVSQTLIDEFCYRIDVDDDLLCVSGIAYDLMFVIDISNPSSPIVHGNLGATSFIVDIDVVGDYAYLCDTSAGLEVVDLSNLDDPYIVTWVGDEYYARSLTIDGQIAYLATSPEDFVIFDMSDPVNPLLVAGFTAEEPMSVAEIVAADNTASIAGFQNVLVTVDITDLENMTELYRSERNLYPYILEKMGDYLIVNEYNGENIVLHLNDPLNPVEVSRFNLGNGNTIRYPVDFSHDDRYLYSGNYSDLLTIDMLDPLNPVIGDTLALPDIQLRAIDTEGDLLVTAGESDYSIGFFDISDPMNPAHLTTLHCPEWPRNAQLDGDLMYVFTPRGLITYNISDINNPLILDEYNNRNTQFYKGTVVDSMAYVIDWTHDHVWIFDVTDPQNIEFVTYFRELNAFALEIRKVGPYVYVGCESEGIKIIDVSDPTSPFMAGFHEEFAYTHDIVVHDNLIYAANYSSLTIYDADQALQVGELPLSVQPESFEIQSIYPNPFNASTTISITVPSDQNAKVMIFNMLGQEVATLFDGKIEAGNHAFYWNGLGQYDQPLPSGQYLLRIENGVIQQVRTLRLLK
ncbi:T9SS type A sorting domain-containing protein [bacterium]|nr:T9SS type A sorting domain-containing protein [bacterium]